MDTSNTSTYLTRKDLIIGILITILMGSIFTILSSGMSLIVTFVPGEVVTLLIFILMFVKHIPLPSEKSFTPLFFGLLAVQFLHFAEEFSTGFYQKFPLLYSGTVYSPELFVWFNMGAYFIFTIACILIFTKRLRFLVVPVLFFIIYGAIGNAISHTWWSLLLRSYFPGLISAQIYWVLGPIVLNKLLGSRRYVILTIILLAAILIPLLTIFMIR